MSLSYDIMLLFFTHPWTFGTLISQLISHSVNINFFFFFCLSYPLLSSSFLLVNYSFIIILAWF